MSFMSSLLDAILFNSWRLHPNTNQLATHLAAIFPTSQPMTLAMCTYLPFLILPQMAEPTFAARMRAIIRQAGKQVSSGGRVLPVFCKGGKTYHTT